MFSLLFVCLFVVCLCCSSFPPPDTPLPAWVAGFIIFPSSSSSSIIAVVGPCSLLSTWGGAQKLPRRRRSTATKVPAHTEPAASETHWVMHDGSDSTRGVAATLRQSPSRPACIDSALLRPCALGARPPRETLLLSPPPPFPRSVARGGQGRSRRAGMLWRRQASMS